MIKILYVAPYRPTYVRVRTQNIINFLSEFVDLTVIYADDVVGEGSCKTTKYKKLSIPNASRLSRYFRCLKAFFHFKPLTYYYYFSRRLAKEASRISKDFDAVFVERLPLQEFAFDIPIIFDCVDCFTNQVEILAKEFKGLKKLLYQYDASCISKFECYNCNLASVILVSAEREVSRLKKLGVEPRILTVSHHSFARNQLANLRREKRVTFHGKMGYAPNQLALRHLDRFQTRLEREGYRIEVLGLGGEEWRRKFPSLRFTGVVDDLVGVLERSEIAMFPITASVGVPNKVLESLYAGQLVWITPQLAEGLLQIAEIKDVCLFIAEADELLESLMTYLKSRKEDFFSSDQRNAGREYVLRYYTREKAVLTLQEIISGQLIPGSLQN